MRWMSFVPDKPRLLTLFPFVNAKAGFAFGQELYK
jgi:hypothetical protein